MKGSLFVFLAVFAIQAFAFPAEGESSVEESSPLEALIETIFSKEPKTDESKQFEAEERKEEEITEKKEEEEVKTVDAATQVEKPSAADSTEKPEAKKDEGNDEGYALIGTEDVTIKPEAQEDDNDGWSLLGALANLFGGQTCEREHEHKHEAPKPVEKPEITAYSVEVQEITAEVPESGILGFFLSLFTDFFGSAQPEPEPEPEHHSGSVIISLA